MLEQDVKTLTEKSVVSEASFSKLFPDIYRRVVEYAKKFNITDWREMKYLYMNQIKERPVCKVCGKPVKFRSVNKGYTDTCSRECDLALKSESHKKLWKNYTSEEKEARLEHVGDVREERTGYRTPFANPEIRKKIDEVFLQKYGTTRYISEEGRKRISESHAEHRSEIDEKIIKTWSEKTVEDKKEINQKRGNTCLEKFGVNNYAKTKEFSVFSHFNALSLWKDPLWKKKVEDIMIERYGVPYPCLTENAKKNNGKTISNINKEFVEMLKLANIKDPELEFSLKKYSYDIKVEDVLIEINPSYTHNSTIGPYFHGKHLKPKSLDYHYNKTKFAIENGYRCIQVWDWDCLEKIIYMLTKHQSLYARECELREVDLDECNIFLDLYHLQNSCKHQDILLGLYYNNELVEIMTFGKPRYNSKYQYELLRLCSRPDYVVIGGANKLFSYFVEKYQPESVISYCDNSKFNGSVYMQLGFSLDSISKPRCHWYNMKTKKHITSNLLNQLGTENLLGIKNEEFDLKEIMIREGFVEVYDCGQSTYVWKKMQ